FGRLADASAEETPPPQRLTKFRQGPMLAGELPDQRLEAGDARARQPLALGPGQVRHLAQDLLRPVEPPALVTLAGPLGDDLRVEVQGTRQEAEAFSPTALRGVIGLVDGIHAGARDEIHR